MISSTKKSFNITNNLKIGYNTAAYIIAEAGLNHKGNVDEAKKLIDIAVNAKANAVKFQLHSTDLFLHPNHPQYDLFKSLEIPNSAWTEIKDYAKSKEIDFIVTPLDFKSLELTTNLNPKIIKIASSDNQNYQFIKEISDTGKPFIVSTGMLNLDEIMELEDFLSGLKNQNYAYLHCISLYPTTLEKVHWQFMKTLMARLDHIVGFSDHTQTPLTALIARIMGAPILEVHVKQDDDVVDKVVSKTEEEFKWLVNAIRDYEKSYFAYNPLAHKADEGMKASSQKGLYAIAEISKGTPFTKQNVMPLRPLASALSAKMFPKIIGKPSKKNYKPFEPISPEEAE